MKNPDKNLIPPVSAAFRQSIVLLIRNDIVFPGEKRLHIDKLKTYCRKEGTDFKSLEENLFLFIELLKDYLRTQDPVIFRFLKAQAKFCYADEHLFGLLSLPVPEKTTLSRKDTGSPASGADGGMAGIHLIGL